MDPGTSAPAGRSAARPIHRVCSSRTAPALAAATAASSSSCRVRRRTNFRAVTLLYGPLLIQNSFVYRRISSRTFGVDAASVREHRLENRAHLEARAHGAGRSRYRGRQARRGRDARSGPSRAAGDRRSRPRTAARPPRRRPARGDSADQSSIVSPCAGVYGVHDSRSCISAFSASIGAGSPCTRHSRRGADASVPSHLRISPRSACADIESIFATLAFTGDARVRGS